jgi:hypothetical protein
MPSGYIAYKTGHSQIPRHQNHSKKKYCMESERRRSAPSVWTSAGCKRYRSSESEDSSPPPLPIAPCARWPPYYVLYDKAQYETLSLRSLGNRSTTTIHMHLGYYYYSIAYWILGFQIQTRRCDWRSVYLGSNLIFYIMRMALFCYVQGNSFSLCQISIRASPPQETFQLQLLFHANLARLSS